MAAVPPRLEKFTVDVGVAVAIVAAATFLSTSLFAVFGATRIGVVFLIAVMFAGAKRGLVSSLAAVLFSTLFYNFFLTGSPYGFRLPTEDEIHNLVLFFVAAVSTGILTERIQNSQRTAIRRASVLATLLEAERVADDDLDERALLERITAVVRHRLPGLQLAISEGPPFSPTTPGSPDENVFGSLRLKQSDGDHSITWSRIHAEFDDFAELLADHLDTLFVGRRARSLAAKLETERSRNLLLTSVSHDFRTPLATIIAAASSLIDFDEALDGGRRLRLITAVRDEAERLDRFVNSMLGAMRRATQGVMDLTIQSLDVRARMDALADRYNVAGLSVRVQVSGSRCWIFADELLFAQAFTNILENAVRHSPVGCAVKVRVQKVRGQVEVVVTDSGAGVPKADMPGIFERYFQSESAQGRGGFGIGLAVASLNVETMGGKLRAANNPGGGLQIIARFPAGAIGEAS